MQKRLFWELKPLLKVRLGKSYKDCKPQMDVVNSQQLLLVSFPTPSFEMLGTSLI